VLTSQKNCNFAEMQKCIKLIGSNLKSGSVDREWERANLIFCNNILSLSLLIYLTLYFCNLLSDVFSLVIKLMFVSHRSCLTWNIHICFCWWQNVKTSRKMVKMSKLNPPFSNSKRRPFMCPTLCPLWLKQLLWIS
jgi:hypothetical protein